MSIKTTWIPLPIPLTLLLLTSCTSTFNETSRVVWGRNLEAGLKQAEAANKPLMLFIGEET